MSINIGMTDTQRQTIAQGLSKVLADTYTLYLKTHNYHWNVRGPMFHSLHTMFETQYNELALAVDEVAERIRALGELAPGSYSEFAKLASIPEGNSRNDAQTMIRELVEGQEAAVRTCRAPFPARGAVAIAGQQGAQNIVPQPPRPVLYITGEESAAQVKLRADRIRAIADTLYLTSETDLGTALAHIEQVNPSLLVIDSVQTLASAEVEGSAGGVTQVREVAASVIAAAKERNMCTLLVGHVTKEGTIAGPRLLEHLVDVVCQFEGDKHSNIRMLRAIKNRFGPTDEVGCFDMHEDGIAPVLDPSGMFVSSTPHPVAGTCVTVTMEGRRPLLAEVQALLDQAVAPAPRRTVSGLDSARIQMLLAVLQRRAGLNVGKLDCYVSTVGGAKIAEPAADLACVMALASAAQNKPLPRKLAVFGEVGLAGEVRAVPGIRQRIAEVGRLGFTHVLVPASPTGVGDVPEGVTVREVTTLGEALALLFPQK